MLHQNEEKSKQEKEGKQRFMGAMKTLGIAALLWQNSIRKESRKYAKSKKTNTIAVLTGAAGYLLLYTSLITLSVRRSAVLPVVLYACAILLFIMLCGIGIKANLKNPKVHWVIEISNVLCQLLVAVSTIILFSW